MHHHFYLVPLPFPFSSAKYSLSCYCRLHDDVDDSNGRCTQMNVNVPNGYFSLFISCIHISLLFSAAFQRQIRACAIWVVNCCQWHTRTFRSSKQNRWIKSTIAHRKAATFYANGSVISGVNGLCKCFFRRVCVFVFFFSVVKEHLTIFSQLNTKIVWWLVLWIRLKFFFFYS